MITSNQIIKMLETYSSSKSLNGNFMTVYENPTISDFQDMIVQAKKRSQGSNFRTIRFIADAKISKFYVADAYISTHTDMCTVLGLSSSYLKEPNVVFGEAGLSGKMLDLFFYRTQVPGSFGYKKAENYNWSFIRSYIQGNGKLPYSQG
jgi:hypothetical protein